MLCRKVLGMTATSEGVRFCSVLISSTHSDCHPKVTRRSAAASRQISASVRAPRWPQIWGSLCIAWVLQLAILRHTIALIGLVAEAESLMLVDEHEQIVGGIVLQIAPRERDVAATDSAPDILLDIEHLSVVTI